MSESSFRENVDVKRLAKLCYLNPSEGQTESLQKDLVKITRWMDHVGQCKTELEPLVNPVDRLKVLGMAQDSALEGPASKEHVLRNAPHSELGYFVVPKCSDDTQDM